MEYISKYTRADAIEDGVLIDVSPLAKEAGFKFPVGITTGINALTDGKDFKGIVWDILNVLRYKAKGGGERINFVVRVGHKDVYMVALCHGGDNLEPVITISLPGED